MMNTNDKKLLHDVHRKLESYLEMERLIGNEEAITATTNMLHLFEEGLHMAPLDVKPT